MSASLDTPTLRAGLARIAAALAGCEGELNELDGRLGDGDLGITVTRGMQTVMAEFDVLPADVGEALAKCAKAFTKASGSSFGTLAAVGLLAVAKATRGRTEIEWLEIPSVLRTALTAMQQRGGADLGDKTVLDALAAAADAMDGMADPPAMLAAAVAAVNKTVQAFRSQPSRRGRARIFAEKSVGQDDPGMIAFQRMLEAIMP